MAQQYRSGATVSPLIPTTSSSGLIPVSPTTSTVVTIVGPADVGTRPADTSLRSGTPQDVTDIAGMYPMSAPFLTASGVPLVSARSSGPQLSGTQSTLGIQPVVASSSYTISFSEKSKGWVSFKTIVPEIGFSLNNEYYTAWGGRLWRHHDDSVDRNSFYYGPDINGLTGLINSESSITVLFNELPSTIKSFNTLNYEGSQAKVVQNLGDGKYYNNQPELGWHASLITTDQQTGMIPGELSIDHLHWQGEFINKEGKWFNYIIGEKTEWKNGRAVDGGSSAPISGTSGNLDTQEFSTQGIGMVTNTPIITGASHG
jgi:hypothetical protein